MRRLDIRNCNVFRSPWQLQYTKMAALMSEASLVSQDSAGLADASLEHKDNDQLQYLLEEMV